MSRLALLALLLLGPACSRLVSTSEDAPRPGAERSELARDRALAVDAVRERATGDAPAGDRANARDGLKVDAKRADAATVVDAKKLDAKKPDPDLKKPDAAKPDLKKPDAAKPDASSVADLAPTLDMAPFPGTFVTIPAGTFQMGSPTTEACRDAVSEVLHPVTLTRAYEMLTTEVTAAQFHFVRGYKPSACNTCPVIDVTWHEAAAFASELSLLRKLAPCYLCTGAGNGVSCAPAPAYASQIASCPGYRLPTEAEWERAYRAGTATPYYNGQNDASACASCVLPDALLEAIAWTCVSGGTAVHSVAQKAPNAWGLYDMAGNAREWVNDWAGFTPTTAALIDPNGPASGSSKLLRGGSFFIHPQYARAASRLDVVTPGFGNFNIGFRVVRSK